MNHLEELEILAYVRRHVRQLTRILGLIGTVKDRVFYHSNVPLRRGSSAVRRITLGCGWSEPRVALVTSARIGSSILKVTGAIRVARVILESVLWYLYVSLELT